MYLSYFGIFLLLSNIYLFLVILWLGKPENQLLKGRLSVPFLVILWLGKPAVEGPPKCAIREDVYFGA